MGEHQDHLSDKMVPLSAVEKVKSYMRRINGKSVSVRQHTRKGDNPYAVELDKAAYGAPNAAVAQEMRSSAARLRAMDKQKKEDPNYPTHAAKMEGVRSRLAQEAFDKAAYEKSKAAYLKGPSIVDKVVNAVTGSHTSAIDKKGDQDEKNRKEALKKGLKPPMVHGASGMTSANGRVPLVSEADIRAARAKLRKDHPEWSEAQIVAKANEMLKKRN